MQFKKMVLFALFIIIAGCASQKTMFNKAQQENTIEAYNQFLVKNTEGEYAEKAKTNKKIIEDIVFSSDDNLRLKSFQEFIKYTFRNNTCDDIEPLKKLLTKITDESKKNSELLPTNIGDDCFFSYLAGLSYIPTIRGNLDDYTFHMNASSLLSQYTTFLQMYESDLNFEYSYLTHNLSKVAYLIHEKKTPENFTTKSQADLQRQMLMRAMPGMAGFAAAVQNGEKNEEVVAAKASQYTKYRSSLASIYEDGVDNLFVKLKSQESDLSVKIFILKKLEDWVQVAGYFQSQKDFLSQLTNSDNSDISESAKKILAQIK